MDLEEKDKSLLIRIFKVRVIRECDLSFREKIFLMNNTHSLIDSGLISRKLEINPLDPPDTEFHYYITSKGEEYYHKFLNLPKI
jgi:hypothetical protein